ncbi:MAG TPA: hypothetical protein VGR57_12945 [Ktedonobacterales bacterium]|nr:hypothetical protein [Ktedonobacterales bacterium]
MKSSQVRELARRYATGQLNQENYRSQRRALIDAVEKGRQALVYKESGNGVAALRRNGVKFLALSVVAALVAGVAISMLLKNNTASRQTAVHAAAAVAVTATPPAPGPGLVRTFLDANDWTDGSLDSFSRRWTALPAEEQAKARISLMYPRLVSDLRQQITSEKAVAGTGADPHLMSLQKMAKTLGVTPAP